MCHLLEEECDPKKLENQKQLSLQIGNCNKRLNFRPEFITKTIIAEIHLPNS